MKSLIVLSCLMVQAVSAQAPDVVWQKTIGSTGPDSGICFLQTEDGGFVIAGAAGGSGGDTTGHYGNDDLWVMKVGSTGNLEWQKTYGGTESEIAFDIDFTADGGYIAAGQTSSLSHDVTQGFGGGDMWVVKLDGSGNLVWQRSYGGSGYDAAMSIKHTASGGYIVVGVTQSMDGDVSLNHGAEDVWVVRLSATGDIVWEKTFGGSNTDSGFSVELTSDGGFIIGGQTLSVDGDAVGLHTLEENITMGDYWLLKLDQSGNLQWQKTLGGFNTDVGFSVYPTSDGGFAIAGQSASNDGDITGNHGTHDYWMAKLTGQGIIEWQKSVGGMGYDECRSIEGTDDGGFILAGSSASTEGDITSSHGSSDYWIAKITPWGTLEWEKSLGGSNGDYGFAVHQTADGFYAMCGYTYSSNGDITENKGESDIWLVKLGPATAGIGDKVKNAFAFYPNPVSSKLYFDTELNVSCEAFIITDLGGRNVLNGNISSQSPIDVSRLPSGIYFLSANGLKHKFVKD